jgi:hypothetical protein
MEHREQRAVGSPMSDEPKRLPAELLASDAAQARMAVQDEEGLNVNSAGCAPDIGAGGEQPHDHARHPQPAVPRERPRRRRRVAQVDARHRVLPREAEDEENEEEEGE